MVDAIVRATGMPVRGRLPQRLEAHLEGVDDGQVPALLSLVASAAARGQQPPAIVDLIRQHRDATNRRPPPAPRPLELVELDPGDSRIPEEVAATARHWLDELRPGRVRVPTWGDPTDEEDPTA